MDQGRLSHMYCTFFRAAEVLVRSKEKENKIQTIKSAPMKPAFELSFHRPRRFNVVRPLPSTSIQTYSTAEIALLQNYLFTGFVHWTCCDHQLPPRSNPNLPPREAYSRAVCSPASQI